MIGKVKYVYAPVFSGGGNILLLYSAPSPEMVNDLIEMYLGSLEPDYSIKKIKIEICEEV